MTLTFPRFTSLGALGLALGWTALSFGTAIAPAPASAQTPARGYYQAVLAQPATKGRAIAGEVVWNCEGTNCTAAKGSSRPLRVCRDVQRKFGEVVSFTARGEALPAEQLARCNG